MAPSRSSSSSAHAQQRKAQPKPSTASPLSRFSANIRLQAVLLAIFAFALYAQTIGFGYAADDGMVILGHRVVQKGFAGIPELLTTDSFRGLDEAEGRTDTRRTYRPLSFISFALEYQCFGANPHISHCGNVALYACAVVVAFFFLRRLLLSALPDAHPLFPFLVCCLFAAHPIHTEVVANIKSRDEIFAFLFLTAGLLLALRAFVPFGEEPNGGGASFAMRIISSLCCFALALLSKESAITFLPVIPCALYLVQHHRRFLFINNNREGEISTSGTAGLRSRSSIVYFVVGLAVLALVYLVVWFGIIGRVEDKLYFDTLHNPFAHASTEERTATATLILGVYLVKSLFPLELSTGYTYNEFPLTSWLHPAAILSAIVLCAIIAGGIFLLVRRSHILSLSLLGWCSTMAIASNYVVYAGGLLGERFLFTPSLFAMLGLAWCIVYGAQALDQRLSASSKQSRGNLRSSSSPVLAIVVILILSGIYAVRTIARSADWRSTETLLAADVQNTPNSIHLRRMYGGLLLRNSGSPTVSPRQARQMLADARTQFYAGIAIDSVIAPSLYNGLGNTFAAERRFDSAIVHYHTALRLAPNSALYRNNLANAYSAYAVKLFSANTPEARYQALSAMQQSVWLSPTDSSYSNLGAMFAASEQTDSAIFYLEKALALNPTLQRARKNLAISYRKRGDTAAAARVQQLAPQR